MGELNDTKVTNLKPAEKTFRISDAEGLYLEVSPSGGKLWQLRYRFNGKQKDLALGKYPAVSLADARDKKRKAQKQLADGKDPGHVKKLEKQEHSNTFGPIAQEWYNNQK